VAVRKTKVSLWIFNIDKTKKSIEAHSNPRVFLKKPNSFRTILHLYKFIEDGNYLITTIEDDDEISIAFSPNHYSH
jgi:hypothetical protein